MEPRLEKIKALGEKRNSTVIAYVVSDRPGTGVQMGEDGIRPMFDHLLGTTVRGKRVDLFIYSRGGGVDVPTLLLGHPSYPSAKGIP